MTPLKNITLSIENPGFIVGLVTLILGHYWFGLIIWACSIKIEKEYYFKINNKTNEGLNNVSNKNDNWIYCRFCYLGHTFCNIIVANSYNNNTLVYYLSNFSREETQWKDINILLI